MLFFQLSFDILLHPGIEIREYLTFETFTENSVDQMTA